MHIVIPLKFVQWNLSNPDTNGKVSLFCEVSIFLWLKRHMFGVGTMSYLERCPRFRGME